MQKRRVSEHETQDNRIRIERYLQSNKRKKFIESISHHPKEAIKCAVNHNLWEVLTVVIICGMLKGQACTGAETKWSSNGRRKGKSINTGKAKPAVVFFKRKWETLSDIPNRIFCLKPNLEKRKYGSVLLLCTDEWNRLNPEQLLLLTS